MKILVVLGIALAFNTVFLRFYCFVQRKQEQGKSTNLVFRFFRGVFNISYHYTYGWMHYCCLMVGRIPSSHVRNFFYKFIFLMDIERNTCISGGCEFRSPWNIHLKKCVIQANCILDGRSSIYIGDNVVFGTGVHIWTQEHDVNDSLFRVLEKNSQPVTVEDRAWICSDSTILPGVAIRKGVVLASRAVATKECEAYGIYAGLPAKRIGERNHYLKYELPGKQHWHFY
jgi:acetyltransferase-like isoleucine patch superfamily enzyme